MTQMTNVADLRAPAQKPTTFPAMLDAFKSEIARALPKHLNPDRMSRIALTAFRRTPALGKCDPRSVFAAVIQASQLGLEPDTLGRSYLIPYGQECQFVPGWKGLVELVNRSGQGTAWTGAVFEGDEFEYALGDSPYVKHRPGGEYAEEKLVCVYAIGRPRGAEWPIIEVWPLPRVVKHRDRYNKVGKRHYSYGNLEMYARKVVLLQVLKYMPMSPELVTAITLNDAAEAGAQGLTVKDAIDGTWAPVTDDSQPEDAQQPEMADQHPRPAHQRTAQSGPAEESENPAPEPARQQRADVPQWTEEEVARRLKMAASQDALDEAASLIQHVSGSGAAERLGAIYKTNRDAIKAAGDQSTERPRGRRPISQNRSLIE